MPRFLDVHYMKGFDENLLRELQNSPVDEFYVEHLNVLYNLEVDKCLYLMSPKLRDHREKS